VTIPLPRKTTSLIICVFTYFRTHTSTTSAAVHSFQTTTVFVGSQSGRVTKGGVVSTFSFITLRLLNVWSAPGSTRDIVIRIMNIITEWWMYYILQIRNYSASEPLNVQDQGIIYIGIPTPNNNNNNNNNNGSPRDKFVCRGRLSKLHIYYTYIPGSLYPRASYINNKYYHNWLLLTIIITVISLFGYMIYIIYCM